MCSIFLLCLCPPDDLLRDCPSGCRSWAGHLMSPESLPRRQLSKRLWVGGSRRALSRKAYDPIYFRYYRVSSDLNLHERGVTKMEGVYFLLTLFFFGFIGIILL